MRILITGGTGLIGRALSAILVGDGHEVIVLSRNPLGMAGPLPTGVRGERWDGKTANGWGHLVDDATAIVNLAGGSIAGDGFLPRRWTPARKRLIRDSRVNAGRAVVQAVQAASTKPRVLIQSSAAGYYGPTQDRPVTEADAPGKDFLAQVCLDWEASTAAVDELGVRRSIIRTGGVVCSNEGGAVPRLMLPFKLFVGGPLGSGRQWLSWIHIADEVAGIRFLLENEATSGAYNLAAPNPLRNAEFARVLGRVLRRPAFVPTPGFAMALAFGELASALLLQGQCLIPHRLQEQGFTFQFPEAEEALRDLLVKSA